MTAPANLCGVFFYDADAPEDERYKWCQDKTIILALEGLKQNFPGMPENYKLEPVEGVPVERLLEVVACE